jgi:hypothetical protein
MLRRAKELKHFKLGARDGEVGRVKDFYFDDESWKVRYFVADTGTWLPGRQVLLSPHAVKEVEDTPHKTIQVDLTRQQIEQSPPIEDDKPVSRQFELEYYQYYNWPIYWGDPSPWGSTGPPLGLGYQAAPVPPPGFKPATHGDPHLRSVAEMLGYQIQALNDHFGHVDDFLINDDDAAWAIRYIVVDTRNWWPGKRVLVPCDWISWVSWPESKVYVDLDRESVKRAPEYDPANPVTREYEIELFAHYGREPYWTRGGRSTQSPGPASAPS